MDAVTPAQGCNDDGTVGRMFGGVPENRRSLAAELVATTSAGPMVCCGVGGGWAQVGSLDGHPGELRPLQQQHPHVQTRRDVAVRGVAAYEEKPDPPAKDGPRYREPTAGAGRSGEGARRGA